MHVSSAVTPDPWMTISFIVFSCIYLFLGVTLIVFLLLLARRKKPEVSWSDLMIEEARRNNTNIEEEALR